MVATMERNDLYPFSCFRAVRCVPGHCWKVQPPCQPRLNPGTMTRFVMNPDRNTAEIPKFPNIEGISMLF